MHHCMTTMLSTLVLVHMCHICAHHTFLSVWPQGGREIIKSKHNGFTEKDLMGGVVVACMGDFFHNAMDEPCFCSGLPTSVLSGGEFYASHTEVISCEI